MSASYSLLADNKTSCGCGVWNASNGATAGITYCDKHHAVDALIGALQNLIDCGGLIRPSSEPNVLEAIIRARAALRRAEGGAR